MIYKCDEALEMLANGSYGICSECEGEIDPGRLIIAPNTNFCIVCKTEIEEAGKVSMGYGNKVPLNRINCHKH
jgi:DnaK suppressor protein